MSAPLGYHRSCVPVAVSTLLGRPIQEVSSLLWDAGCARAMPADGAGGTEYATQPHGAADVMLRLGHRVQLWNPDGQLFLSVPDYRYYARATAHSQIGRVERARPERTEEPRANELVQRLDTDPEPTEPPRLLTVREWQSRFPHGRWLLIVAGDGPNRAHALALIDAEIEAGGTQFRDVPVFTAFRILPPKSIQLEGINP